MKISTSRVHIIAEAGTNHNGRLDRACQLADIACRAPADSIKIQVIYPEGLYLPAFCRGAGRYEPNDVFRKREAARLSDDDILRLAEHCRKLHLPFSASVFDRRGVDLLNTLDAPYIKIASCDLNHTPLLKYAAESGRKLILSTGMSTLAEIENAVMDITSTGHRDLVLMHCVSIYPCPTERANVGFIQTLLAQFGLPVGFSDHTENSLAAAMAVGLGATWIEKHFTLNRGDEGFDHAYAMEPESLAQYTYDVRLAEQACTAPDSKLTPAEQKVMERARRSLYAARDLQAGELLRENDILVVRPAGSLTPRDVTRILGRMLNKPVRRYESLREDVLNPPESRS